jgi:hypothetical protein
MQEHVLTGRIARLLAFKLPEFGIRARFTIEATEWDSVICAVEGNLAREFITRYCEGDVVNDRFSALSRIYSVASTTRSHCPFAPLTGHFSRQ